jgi:hypothetical protein
MSMTGGRSFMTSRARASSWVNVIADDMAVFHREEDALQLPGDLHTEGEAPADWIGASI